MKIDLFYYTPYLNNYYFVYGPEKDSNGDIYIKPTGYYFADANDMVAKLRSMADSLAPEITNVQARNQGNSFWIYVGDLNTGSSDVPDYTQLLTRIANSLDTNSQDTVINKLQSINEKLTTGGTSIAVLLEGIFFSLNSGYASGTASNRKSSSYLRFLTALSAFGLGSDDTGISDNSNLKNIWRTLRQSAAPNANITDVISALNATIDSKQDTTIVNNEVTPLAEINIDVPFEVKNLKKSDVENL